MAASYESPTAYIQHHLTFFARPIGEGGFWTVNIDTVATTFVLGVLRDKDAAGILAPLLGRARHVVLTASRNPRAAAPADLRALLPASMPVTVAPSIREALAVAEAQAGTPILCVAGSLSLIGDALAAGPEGNKPCPVENGADSIRSL